MADVEVSIGFRGEASSDDGAVDLFVSGEGGGGVLCPFEFAAH